MLKFIVSIFNGELRCLWQVLVPYLARRRDWISCICRDKVPGACVTRRRLEFHTGRNKVPGAFIPYPSVWLDSRTCRNLSYSYSSKNFRSIYLTYTTLRTPTILKSCTTKLSNQTSYFFLSPALFLSLLLWYCAELQKLIRFLWQARPQNHISYC